MRVVDSMSSECVSKAPKICTFQTVLNNANK